MSDGIQRAVPGPIGALWPGRLRVDLAGAGELRGPGGSGRPWSHGAWLAQTFATLDGQAQPLAQDEFNAALEARVRLFQRQFKLRDDGVVGLKTLLKLNTVRGEGTALLQSGAEVAQLGERCVIYPGCANRSDNDRSLDPDVPGISPCTARRSRRGAAVEAPGMASIAWSLPPSPP